MSPTPRDLPEAASPHGSFAPCVFRRKRCGRDCCFSEARARASKGGLSVRYGQHRPIEFVVEADADNVGREPDILSKNYGRRERGNGVVEDGVFAKIDMQIF